MLPFSDRTVRIDLGKYLPSHIRGIPVPREPQTVGGHLRRRRLQLKLHQSQAARKLNISTVTMSRWECDKVFPTEPFHRQIEEYLGYNPFNSATH
jgi:DNA-binding XRE family transcriptional regulator